MKSLRSLRSILVAAAALVAGAASAHAQAAPAQAERQAPSLTVVAENRTAMAEAARGARRSDTTVHANDVLRYRLTFTNTAGRPVRAVAIQNPVAAGLQFVAGSAKASRADVVAEYSVDGGKTWSARPMETVVVDGRTVERPVAPERYTTVRWTVGSWVTPGATVTAEFEARLVLAPAKVQGTNAATPAPGAR